MLSPGARLGPYEILRSLGAGGMGEVYRARDNRLGRDVAIKILPPAFASDPDRLSRFEREARVLASLNHPHIAAIYGLEESSDVKALVLELVDGETLAARIARRRQMGLPPAEALSIARQIADALDAAHEKGVTHRDLKPANIAITPEGVVKVLDFGLAKAMDPASGIELHARGDVSNSPTLTSPALMTSQGIILGTAAYMSPEQARGEPVDRRTDMWAFGCVLFEMLTGRAPFAGDSVAGVLSEVLKSEPDWQRLPPGTPDNVRRLLIRCLQKDRALRWRDAGDVRIQLDEITARPEAERAQPAAPRNRIVGAIAAAVVAAIAGAAASALFFRGAAPPGETRLEITTPPTVDASMAISPDGTKVVFSALSAGRPQLWLRALDSSDARPLKDTERGFLPFWSPDSRSLGFFVEGKVKRLDLDRGSLQTLATTPAAIGGAWNRDGTILLSTNPGRPIMRMPAAGGALTPLTRFEAQQGSQGYPSLLDDGRHFLFFVSGRSESRGEYIGSVDSLDSKRLFATDTPATYSPGGYAFFVREDKLLAQAIDASRLEAKGDALLVAEHVNATTAVSTSATGTIAYRTGSSDSGQHYLAWMDRSGREISRVIYPDTSGLGPALSPDGRHVALFKFVDGNMDIWSYDMDHRTWDRMTFDPGDDIFPVWSPNGTRMIFASNRNAAVLNLYSKAIDAPPGSEELLLSTPRPKFGMDWSSDGQTLLYNELSAKGDLDIWALPLGGTHAPFVVVQTEFNELQPQFSPDGKWIAYQSDKTGRPEIYVQPFPGPGGAVAVSTNGGGQPRWSRDGKSLFYVAFDDRLTAVSIRALPGGKTIDVGAPLALFTSNVGGGDTLTPRQHYSVSSDGQTFVMNGVPQPTAPSIINLILNWKPKR